MIFGHVTTFCMFLCVKLMLMPNATNNPALVCFILKVSLCGNHQKQQKEAPSYFELKTL